MKSALSPPVPNAPPLVVPSALNCLTCQLVGRRKLLCSRSEACRELPHVFALGPALLVGWIATLVAFALTIM